MTEHEQLLTALLNQTKYMADAKINHWVVVSAVAALKRAGVPKNMLPIPNIDYIGGDSNSM